MSLEQSSLRGYSERDVSSLVGLPLRQIRSYAREGLFPGWQDGEGMLSFEDLVLLRTAKDLVDSKVAPRRVRSMLKRLRDQLPADKPLSAVRLSVEGKEIVVHDGPEAWEAESGQVVLDFSAQEKGEGDVGGEAVPGPVPVAPIVETSAQDLYDQGCELEESSPAEARKAYLGAIEQDPDHLDAHLNLGRMLHEARDFRGAEHHYRRALEINPLDATAAFNLGVVLEDVGLRDEAIAAYELAIECDPAQIDAYHNAVRLYEESGDKASAVRVLKRLRGQSR